MQTQNSQTVNDTPKNHRNCPSCNAPTLVEEFVIVRRQSCGNCQFFTQTRITPVMQGGLAMIAYLTDYMIEHNGHLGGLEAALQQQLAKVQRREAKRKSRVSGGSPSKEEDWQ